MSTILALDASTEACSVALLGPSLNLTLCSEEPRTHARKFLPLIDAILQLGSLSLKEVDAVAYGSGPGSFTGLRIAFGCAQGLAYGANLPMIAVSGLEAMAAAVSPDGIDNAAACVLDARMGEVYWAVYSHTSGELTCVSEPRLSSPQDALEGLARLQESAQYRYDMVGSGAALLPLDSRLRIASIYSDIRPSAQSVATLAMRRFMRGEVTSAEHAQLYYLRDSVSWNKRQRARKGASGSDQ